MSLPQIIGLSLVEIVGDFGFKQYANHGGIKPFMIGTVGYIGVIIMLIVSLQGSTVLMVNSAWDGVSGLLESVCAFVFLGERFHNYLQYFGAVFIVIGLSLLHIPMSKSHPFHIPHL
jgi:multidrug transporter EmrE-like cation transporter